MNVHSSHGVRLSELLSSEAKVRLLSFLVSSSEDGLYLRAIARRLGLAPTTLQKPLDLLERAGIVTSSIKGRVRLFSVNRAHALFEDLKRLLLKTEGLGRLLREALAEIKNIEAAVIFGSFAEGKEVSSSDIDLLIIGDPDLDALNRVLDEAERFHGRAINHVVFSQDEWRSKVQAGDSFAKSILSGSVIPLLGRLDATGGAARVF